MFPSWVPLLCFVIPAVGEIPCSLHAFFSTTETTCLRRAGCWSAVPGRCHISPCPKYQPRPFCLLLHMVEVAFSTDQPGKEMSSQNEDVRGFLCRNLSNNPNSTSQPEMNSLSSVDYCYVWISCKVQNQTDLWYTDTPCCITSAYWSGILLHCYKRFYQWFQIIWLAIAWRFSSRGSASGFRCLRVVRRGDVCLWILTNGFI